VTDVLFLADPPARFDPSADSTYVMIREAIRRGHVPYATTLDGLLLDGAQASAHAGALSFSGDDPAAAIAVAPTSVRPLSSFAVVLMRKDPPFDSDYLTATWMLERARESTLVLNDPRGLRELNEKLAILPFPELIPRTRILRKTADLRAALADFGGRMIVKPVFGFGGREVLQAREGDPNLSSILEIATRDGGAWTVAQEFVEAAGEGDKRILLVDGEPIGAVLRVPSHGELRGNFHAGGTAQATQLDARDLEICKAVRPMLREQGQFFVGLDVIGGLMTEINVTSPTGMQEINRLENLRGDDTMQARFWAGIEAKWSDDSDRSST
jgi:glutathione synthase